MPEPFHAPRDLTFEEIRVLLIIRDWRLWRGVQPNALEIMTHCGRRDHKSTQDIIARLRKRGLVTGGHKGQGRSLRTVPGLVFDFELALWWYVLGEISSATGKVTWHPMIWRRRPERSVGRRWRFERMRLARMEREMRETDDTGLALTWIGEEIVRQFPEDAYEYR